MNLPIIIGVSPTLHIRGIIAAIDIKKNTVIERSPVILTDIKDDIYLDKTKLRSYYFTWNKKYSAVALGYASLYNHSYTPNARFAYNYHKKLLIIQAIKLIKKGEEIFLNYNYHPDSKKELDAEYFKKDKTYNTIRS